MKAKKVVIALISLVVLLVVGRIWIDRLLELRMHVALGYGSVYSLNMTVELIATYGCALLFAVLSALAFSPRLQDSQRGTVLSKLMSSLRWLAAVIGWTVGYAIGHIDPTKWMLFFVHEPFHRSDPLFHVDLAFYVFQLPVLTSLISKIIAAALYFALLRALSAILSNHSQFWRYNPEQASKTVSRALRHALLLVAVVFFAIAAREFLGRYIITYSVQEGNFLYGPGFTDTHFTIPVAVWIHAILALSVGVLLAIVAFKPNLLGKLRKLTVGSFVGYLLSHAATGAVAAAINAFYVHPNQGTVEAPYIQRTIDETRWALGIDRVKTATFDPNTEVDANAVLKDAPLLKNVRVNDIGQTQNIYNQLQSFKNYFVFLPATVDRYNGQQVYIDARQMDVTKLPVKTWVNQTLVYTHGYGIVASPVNQFDADGLPTMLAKDTPQVTTDPLPKVTRPEIYFGTMDNDVIAPSKQPEFDYPQGSADHTSHYQGGYGLPIQGNRWLLTLTTGSFKYVTSDQFTSDSQLLFDRNIYTRVQDIAPFLDYDSDVFPFIDGQGHIEWMLDAYTETTRIPYAQTFNDVAYIRNSVKVVMDAYTGKTTFYVVDPSDPMIQSLMKLYPRLFVTDVPADIRAHFRYPADLFSTQAQALTRYHMTTPDSFYNQEDLWDQAQEIYEHNQVAVLPPVYQLIRMPDRSEPSFVISELFTPNQKMNLNGWLIADNDPDKYGQLTLYQFPQSKLTFGPMQAENQIDSDPGLSAQLTLWNQQGSHVIRGNLLLVPLGNSVLYVEPIYLVAARQGSLPQLQRVVVDFNKKVYVGNSLGDALNMMLKDATGNAPLTNIPPVNSTGGNQKGNLADLANQANQLFEKYKKDTASGKLGAAGQDLDQLGQVIRQMASLASTDQKK